MTLPSERRLPWLFLILLVAVLALAGWQWRDGAPLSANLMELVPGTAPDALELRAEQRMQEPLNREMLVLVGHKRSPAGHRHGAETGRAMAGQRFVRKGPVEPASRLAGAAHAIAARPTGDALGGWIAQQLIEHPDAFIQQRVQALFDPFTGFSLVPSQDDWLGLTGRIQNSQPQHGAVQLDIGSGALIADADGKSWVLLRAHTTGNAFDMNLPLQVADLLEHSREEAAQADVQLLAASGLLYAANGQRQATREMTWVGGGATVGILLLLLLAFRRWRVLLAFVPVLVGMLFGAVACVALFGHMHVMTLVLGSSLIGVAVDYPLHYLSKSWSLKPWHSWPALRLTLPGLTLSLITSCIGYLALAWTPFPALTQIAVFSAAGLLGAYLSAVCLLPALLKGVNLRPAQWPLRVCECLLNLREALLKQVSTPVLLALLIAFCVGGLLQLESKNDIRQWIGAPQQLTDEARTIARITGYQPTSQFFLVRAANQQRIARTPDRAERAPGSVGQPGKTPGLPVAESTGQPAERSAARCARR